jgi:hypothetical protein
MEVTFAATAGGPQHGKQLPPYSLRPLVLVGAAGGVDAGVVAHVNIALLSLSHARLLSNDSLVTGGLRFFHVLAAESRQL